MGESPIVPNSTTTSRNYPVRVRLGSERALYVMRVKGKYIAARQVLDAGFGTMYTVRGVRRAIALEMAISSMITSWALRYIGADC